jgi:hypothetical protein
MFGASKTIDQNGYMLAARSGAFRLSLLLQL